MDDHGQYSSLTFYIQSTSIDFFPSCGYLIPFSFLCTFLAWQVEKLVLINGCVYKKGTGHLANLPKLIAYAGVGSKVEFCGTYVSNRII